MEENKMKINELCKGTILSIANVFNIFFLLALSYYPLDVAKEQKHQELAKKVAMYHYRSVGNGGALAEMSGRVSAERSTMYGQITEIYSHSMLAKSTIQLEEEYKRLESGIPIDRRALLEEVVWRVGN